MSRAGDADSRNIETALTLWAGVVGPERVIVDAPSLTSAGTATFAWANRVGAILQPEDRQQVQECVRIANRCAVPVYPISGGKNWGYGSRAPSCDGAVMLDLRRLNRILDFSEDLAYVTVEPGVTQGQLYTFLRDRKSRLWMDASGASPDASIVGNTVDRGFGHTPYGDHFAHCCGLEIVLPGGEVIDTGFSRFSGSSTGPLYGWGVGPSLDGLFSQSNLGIITRMTVWLMPAPEYFQAFFFRSDDQDGLGPVVEALRPLRLDGTLRSTVHIGNDYKVLSGLRQYPWDEMGGATPLSSGVMARFRKTLKFGWWNGSGGLYGTKAQVAEARRLLRRALHGKVAKLQFLDDRMLRLAIRFAKPYSLISGWDLSRTLELLQPVYGLMKGIPTADAVASTYWRKRTPPPAAMDPDRDGCGLLWCSPIAPAEGGHARRLTALASEILISHGFEPQMSLSMVNERTLACVISITYDRAVPDEDERALVCHRELVRRMAENGYYLYRLGLHSMEGLYAGGSHAALLDSIKQLLDPNRVLAPGRYEPCGRESKPLPGFIGP
jgi:4-cresol dehydrogenase (hydroxylating)